MTDICEYDKVMMACKGQDALVHAAALKIVSVGERAPWEYLRVNVIGTETVIRAWGETHASDENFFARALFISSDKAVEALNLYGRCKAVASNLWRASRGCVLRYGNVVSSRGTFLHKWREAVERGEAITVREPEPTRFFLTMPAAIALVEDALRLAPDNPGSLFVPRNLRAFSVWDVARETGAMLSYEPLLPGEKQHEILLASGERAEPMDRLLARVEAGYGFDRSGYCSETAPRMSGREVLEAVGWKS